MNIIVICFPFMFTSLIMKYLKPSVFKILFWVVEDIQGVSLSASAFAER